MDNVDSTRPSRGVDVVQYGTDCMKLTFLGATQTVTGSKFLIETQDRRILLDCGLFQGSKELRLRNWEAPPVDPKSIDAVVLTHAHIDHTGYLPRFVAHAYKGPVFATSATVDLPRILLPDAGHLQEEEANYRNKHHLTKHKPALPLYTVSDAMSSVHVIDSFSAHGDYRKILRWLAGFKRAPRTTFLVHGEPVAAAAMKDHILVSHKGWGVEIPAYRQMFEIN